MGENRRGTIITFYSYKGGTGRSMALANLAWVLASRGKHVLVIDWDLEAPGLHRYFQPFIADADLVDTAGLIDYLWDLCGSIMTPASGARGPETRGPDLLDYRVGIDWSFKHGGSLDLIPAGRQGVNYPQRVNSFDWENFYERLGGGHVLSDARVRLREAYHYVLIDSRTGVSDTSGICTVQMPDLLVALFTLNNQSIEGVAAILESALALRDPKRDGPLRVFPVMSRVEDGEQDKLAAAQARARNVFSRFLDESSPQRVRAYWDDMEIPYKKFYAYEEVLATFGDKAGARGSERSLLTALERIARRVTGLRDISMPEVPEAQRRAVLAKYAFATEGAGSVGDLPPLARSVYELVTERFREWQANARSPRYRLRPAELAQLELLETDFSEIDPALGDYVRQSRHVEEYLRALTRLQNFTGKAAVAVGILSAVATLLSDRIDVAMWLPALFVVSYGVILVIPFLIPRPPDLKLTDGLRAIFGPRFRDPMRRAE